MTYRWRNGWDFERDSDGNVSIWNTDVGVRLDIPADEWARIIVRMGTGFYVDREELAEALHVRKATR